jgi:hypothetical protein
MQVRQWCFYFSYTVDFPHFQWHNSKHWSLLIPLLHSLSYVRFLLGNCLLEIWAKKNFNSLLTIFFFLFCGLSAKEGDPVHFLKNRAWLLPNISVSSEHVLSPLLFCLFLHHITFWEPQWQGIQQERNGLSHGSSV